MAAEGMADALMGANQGGNLLGASGQVDFSTLLFQIRTYLVGMTNTQYDVPIYGSGIDQYNGLLRFHQYIEIFLPYALAILGTVLAIKLAIKLFKKFSR